MTTGGKRGTKKSRERSTSLIEDPRWYQDAIFYEVIVRAFADSNGDGFGDLRGLIGRLDYLQWLGVDCLWLLPMYESPLRDGGYDIADFRSILSKYGDTKDFRRLLDEAHKRDMRVIADLVVNHTSDQHAWFQEARSDPASPLRGWYVWSESPERYADARIIFLDSETSNWSWDPQAGAFYWHRFFSHQPDLNFDNPEVQQAMLDIVAFWMDLGIDGFRVDAVPYLFEQEGTSCENLPETHGFCRRLRALVDERYPGRALLAEANQWPEDVVAYFADGDEFHMAFHFPIMPRLFIALGKEDRGPILDILARTPAIPDGCQWGIFLRNHDELTLEMVTEEERDYLYRTYAADPRMRLNLGIRRRLAPLLNNDRRRIELMHGLLCSLPGSPVLYYGDELGMGDNIWLGDRDGVRTPMQWTAGRNAGFSKAARRHVYLPPIDDPVYGFKAVNVEAQMGNEGSLLRWVRHLLRTRRRSKAFGRGTFEVLDAPNQAVLAFARLSEDDVVVCLFNLSSVTQPVLVDLSRWAGLTPMEMLGDISFPTVRDAPYQLALGPHAFMWLRLDEPG